MRVVIQRVVSASVSVDSKIISKIEKGLLLLVAFSKDDDINDVKKYAMKIVNMRIFEDDSGLMNLSAIDVGAEILSVSQFTLYGDVKKGNRPSFVSSMKRDKALEYYNKFNEELIKYLPVKTGVYGADMKVSLINDGPVTIIL